MARRPATPAPTPVSSASPKPDRSSAGAHPPAAPRSLRAVSIALGAVFALALCGAALLQWRRSAADVSTAGNVLSRQPAVATLQGASAAGASTPDNVLSCRGFPHFAQQYGFTGGLIISTTDRERMGLVLHDPKQPAKGFQHPNGTWDDAGYLGPFAIDKSGNVYTAPVPRTDLVHNPPAGATTIWRLDTDSGELRPFLTVDAAAPPSERNPFGVIGLAYDCTTNSLYAASVAGASPSVERGRIVRIDLATQAMTTVLDGVDVLGIAVVQMPEGKRLYYGSARVGELWSLGLDAAGNGLGDARVEADQGTLGTTSEEKVRRIAVSQGELTVAVVPFAFTLQARSDPLQRSIVLHYDAALRRWHR